MFYIIVLRSEVLGFESNELGSIENLFEDELFIGIQDFIIRKVKIYYFYYLDFEIWKIVLSFIYVFIVFLIIVFIMVIVYERVFDVEKYFLLFDIFLDNVSFIFWVFYVVELIGMGMGVVWIIIFFFYKYR